MIAFLTEYEGESSYSMIEDGYWYCLIKRQVNLNIQDIKVLGVKSVGLGVLKK